MAYIKKNNLTKLTKIRQDLGMTRAQLAEKSGVSARAIERYEQHRSSINDASVGRVRDLARALGVPIESIIDDD